MTVIALDLGGTKLSGACFAEDGTAQHRTSTPLGERSGAAVGALIVAQARELMARGAAGVAAVGVAVPGIYRAASGTVWAPNIPGWDDYPLVAELRAALPANVVVRVDSDRACAILGEAWAGRARGSRNAIFLAVGTGIGAGILCEGVVLRGTGDAAGAIGWLALDRPYRPEYPSVGCFEYHASGTGLAAVAQRLVREQPHHTGPLRDRDATSITAHDVFTAYDQGDAVARRVLDDAIGYWGMAIANLISLFNPERIILGGGVFGPGARFLDRIRAEARQWAQPISSTQVEIELSALGSDAVLYGAGALGLHATVNHPTRVDA
ncbi:MAG TPA: ROK family protein [Longimicrobiales bacterium]